MQTLRWHLPVLALLVVLNVAPLASADCAPRPQDTVWMVDTRGAGCPDALQGNEPQLKYSRFDHDHWVRVTQADFFASDDPAVPTCIMLHGNMIDVADASDMGLSMYSQLVAGVKDPTPLRFVIFTWPAERISGGILNDVRVKAYRSDTAGYYLAWLVDRMDPQVKLTLIGYSFGARSVSGALELLGGGRLAGYELTQRVHPQRTAPSVVLMAAALDDDWLLPGGRDEKAVPQMDRLLLVNNGCDMVLKRYRFLYCGGCAAALGYEGLATSALPPPERSKIQQMDACCDVGKRHEWASYVYSSDIMARVRPYVLSPSLNGSMASK